MATQNLKVNVAFEGYYNTDGKGFSFIPHLGEPIYARHEKHARTWLKRTVKKKVEQLIEQDQNWQREVIGCVDGTVLEVEFRHGGWGYRTLGPNRAYAGGVAMANATFDAAKEYAREQAIKSYGGIAWVTR